LTNYSFFVRVLLASRFIPLYSYIKTCGQLYTTDAVDSLEPSFGWISKKVRTLKTKRCLRPWLQQEIIHSWNN